MKSTRKICISLPAQTLKSIDSAARQDGRPRSNFIGRILERAIADDASATAPPHQQEIPGNGHRRSATAA
jgi:metal-responsive CopG/Arc/MetJ family transcriptional regulator